MSQSSPLFYTLYDRINNLVKVYLAHSSCLFVLFKVWPLWLTVYFGTSTNYVIRWWLASPIRFSHRLMGPCAFTGRSASCCVSGRHRPSQWKMATLAVQCWDTHGHGVRFKSQCLRQHTEEGVISCCFAFVYATSWKKSLFGSEDADAVFSKWRRWCVISVTVLAPPVHDFYSRPDSGSDMCGADVEVPQRRPRWLKMAIVHCKLLDTVH